MKTKSTVTFIVLATTLLSGYAVANSYPNNNNTSTIQANNNATVPDSTLTTQVRTALAADDAISDLNVRVNTENGVVMISGNVDTDDQASAIIQDASSIDGVKDVDASKLVVKKSVQPYTDTVITAKIKGSFLREKLFGSASVPVMSISVETTNGVVYLTGTADNQTQANEAVTIAKSIDGVKDVQSKVQIKPE